MNQSPEKLHRVQKQAKEYMDKHGIEKIVTDMLNIVLHSKEEKPIIFMIKFLSGLCSEEELSENGIKITGKLPKHLPILRYPRFPESCNSLLKKYLTEAMWRELRNIKTKHEGRLANCILAGIEEPELPIGVFACDGEAYLSYKKLFEPIIKDLHHYDLKSGAIVRHNYDISSLEWGRLERTKHCIKFVQVTGSRNLEGYPFVPILDSSLKYEIENKLSKVLVEEIDVKTPINKLKELERKRFSEENLLFGSHPSIEKAFSEAKCCEGCSIYYNNDLSKVIWINADDHIQFFITQRINPDLKSSCEKLFHNLKLLEAHIPLSHDLNIGYLTCNPAFLGTALRIEVLVQLQRASESQIKFEVLKNYCIQQGVEVRFAGSNTYEFALKKAFQPGKTESEMVRGLVNSLADLLRIEETVMDSEGEMMKNNILEENEKILKEIPVFDEINTSLIKPFINEGLWLRLGRVPSSFGHSLKDCVKPGVANHKIGIIALDADCYHKFEELFMNVINIYHEDYKLL